MARSTGSAAPAQTTVRATRRTSLLRPAQERLDRRHADGLLGAEQPVDRLVVGEAGVVEHEDRAAQRRQRVPVDDEDGRDLERRRRACDPTSWNSSSMRRTRPSGSPSTSTSSGRESQSVSKRGAESAVTKPLSQIAIGRTPALRTLATSVTSATSYSTR